MFPVRIFLLTFIALLLVTVGTLILARQQSADPSLNDLQRCGDQICALGISPSITTFDDALGILRSNPYLESSPLSPELVYKRTAPFFELVLSKSLANVSVERVDIYFQSSPLAQRVTAGQIIMKFGSPCLIIPYYGRTLAALIYPNMTLYFRADSAPLSNRFLHSARVAEILLQASNARECSQMKIVEYSAPWRGFRAY